MADEFPYPVYADPGANPFPDPFPEEPKPREEREAEAVQQSQTFSSPSFNPEDIWKKIDEPAQPVDDEKGGEIIQKACAAIFIIAVIIGIAGAGIWYAWKHAKNVLPAAAPVQGLISAKEGGKVSAEGAEVIIPPGALAKDEVIKIEKAEEGAVTDLYYFKPEGLKFLKPVTLSVPYKESGLKKGETPYDINLEYWAADKEGVKRKLKFTVDKDAKMLRTQVHGF